MTNSEVCLIMTLKDLISYDEPMINSSNFTGRSDEITEIENALTDPEHNVISIIGRTGTGKTSLVRAVTERQKTQKSFPGGIFWINYLKHTSFSDILDQIRSEIKIPSEKKQFDSQKVILSYFQSNPSLIIFDDFHPSVNSEVYSFVHLLPTNSKLILISQELMNIPIYSRNIVLGEIKKSENNEINEQVVFKDETKLQFDAPVSLDMDQLGRGAFAEDIAIRLSRLWMENKITEDLSHQSFIIHLYSPWGAGKTSFLKMLQEKLELNKSSKKSIMQFFRNQIDFSDESHKRPKWCVIRFDSWRNQHIDPPWWSLFDTIYRQSVKKKNFFSRSWIGFLEFSWRLITESTVFLLIAFLLCYLGFIYLLSVIIQSSSSSITLNQFQIVSTIFTIIGMIWAGTLTLRNSLISGSADSAQTFIKISQDPMENIRNHFREFVDRIDSPMIVFIDDLDRCKPEYVVRLLESIQTILNHPQVFYVVAADRRWLNASFQSEYADLAKEIKDPGRNMYHLFLEKIFQLSVALPPIPKDLRDGYWKSLLDTKQSSKYYDKYENIVRNYVINGDHPEYNNIRENFEIILKRQKITSKILADIDKEDEKDTIHFLQRFNEYIYSNPRWMKRAAMAYSLSRDRLLLSGREINDELRIQLALWTIVNLRWPCIADYLERYPYHINIFLKDNPSEDDLKKVVDEDILNLLKNNDTVKSIFKGFEKVTLNAEVIRFFSDV